MNEFLSFIATLLGFVPVVAAVAPLVAFLVDTAKRFGLPDGYAPLASGLLNLLVYALFYFVELDEAAVQNVVEAILAIAPYIVALLISLFGSAWAHQQLAKIGVGYRHPKG